MTYEEILREHGWHDVADFGDTSAIDEQVGIISKSLNDVLRDDDGAVNLERVGEVIGDIVDKGLTSRLGLSNLTEGASGAFLMDLIGSVTDHVKNEANPALGLILKGLLKTNVSEKALGFFLGLLQQVK